MRINVLTDGGRFCFLCMGVLGAVINMLLSYCETRFIL